MNFGTKSKNSRKRYRDVYNFGVQKRCNCVKKHTRKHHPALSLPLKYKQNQCENFEILISKLIGSMWNSMKNECHFKPLTPWKRSIVHAKTCKNAEIPEYRRKPSMNTSQKINEKSSTSRLYFTKKCSNQSRQNHPNPRKWTHLEPIRLVEAVRTVCKNCEICENQSKSQKIIDE